MSLKSRLRNLAKATFQRFDLDLVRRERVPECTLNELDLAYGVVSRHRHPGTFIQVGANDGITRDPIRHLVLQHGLRGVFVEPVPPTFELLKENYEDVPNVYFENVAIGTTEGSQALFVPRSGRSGLGSQIASFSKSHLMSHGFAQRDIDEFIVPTVTLDSLIQKHEILGGHPDLLVVDTEGFDFQVVKMCLESKIRPGAIYFENCHLSASEKYQSRKLLTDEGYVFFETMNNTCAVDETKLLFDLPLN